MKRQEPVIQPKLTPLEGALRLVLLIMMICALPATLFATMGAAFAEHQSLHGIFCHQVNHVGLTGELLAVSGWETW
ncbi:MULTISPECIES: hypothetical protein [unclassified Neorhizobium]|uniref:hypothetical protein n=1 Tax=unclassified Neorhizobium TaxID=2629175 RepID=UPI001FF6BB8A|nr:MULTISPECIES: hypothetical protein [unclassified Neorhizobium]MCJ9672041.1 hypothetical protein [Neorhizobium sp. SHOUNA12B]MCJ9746322.1 hypothetical protein [Neorhizobium sp. SHOUNA12A]